MNEKLIEWNNTDIEIGYKGSLDVLLHERFTENAERVAAKDQSGEFTYAQLEAASNAVSDIVRTAAEQNVCVLVGNRAERLAYVTGIIKAGKTYVPLGMNTPVKRNMEIVSNVEPGFILTDEENREDAELIASECGVPADKVLIRTMSELEKADCGFTPAGRSDDSIAYIIHTSGSNGKPKGVLSPDLGLRNLCWCCRLYFDITPEDSTCAVHNCSFDASIIDMFPFMMAGATIHFIPDEMKADIFTLNEYMIRNGITIQELPTTLYHHFIDLENPVLHTLIAGGEKMLKYRKKSYQIFNAYGPSEASVYSTIIKLDGEYDDIPIGRPIYNTKVLILREDGTIADIGEEGEICVTGVHLAKGYLNEPEQQAKAFVPSVLDPDKIMYKTGDVGMWTEEGYILCSGRKDFQIKHRGFRIELDEIRHHLMEMPEIADCAVLYHKRENGGYIACFYVSADGGEIGRDRLRSYSLEFLPEYMVPGKWISVSEIPVTANHKIDRRALEAMLDKERSSAPAGAGAGESVAAGAAGGGNGGNAAGSIESRVRSIWAEVLDVDPDFGADETFNGLGGHSIMSLVMLKKIKEEFGVNISFIDFQKKNSFGDLLAMIETEAGSAAQAAGNDGEAGSAGGAGNGGSAAGSIESKVRSIWAEVLDVDPDFGADETFNELGGHSIMSLVMLKKIKEEFGVNISFIDFQKKNSFGDLLSMIRAEVEPAETCSFTSDREHRFDDFPLTGMQQAYYFGRMDNMHLGTTPTHLYIEVDIREFDKAKFVRVINRITEAHDALRLRVSDEGTQRIVPQQIITEDMITFADASQLGEEGKQRAIVAARKEINSIDIDYTNSPLARVTVVLTGGGSARVGLYLDGFVADGWSQDILLRDFDALWKDETQQLAEEKYLFRDYVNFVNSLKTGEGYEKARDFWMERLPELPGVPELPLKKAADDIYDPSIKNLDRYMGMDEWNAFEKKCKAHGITTSNAMMTVFGRVLARWSRQNRFVINIPMIKRFFEQADFEDTFGICTDFIIFDMKYDRTLGFGQEAHRNQEHMEQLIGNSLFSGMDVIREMSKQRGTLGNATPVVFTSLVDVPEHSYEYVKKVFFQTHTSQVWIDAIVLKSGGRIQFSWDYVADLFEDHTVNAMIDTLVSEIRRLALYDDAWENTAIEPVSAFPVDLDSAAGPVTEVEYRPLAEMLLDSFAAHGENVAVISCGREYTYDELLSRSYEIAAKLQKLGLRQGGRAVVLMDKCFDQVASVIGTVLCGAAYVPLDTQNTSSRIAYCFEQTEAAAILTDSEMLAAYPEIKDTCIVVDTGEMTPGEKEFVRPEYSLDDLYGIIYTSGSTGMPKGVMLHQAGLINCMAFTKKLLHLTEADRMISLTNLCHDMSIYDIFGILAEGAAVVLPDKDKTKDPDNWLKIIRDHKVTLWNSVPAITEMMLAAADYSGNADITSLRVIFMGGEKLKKSIPTRLRKLNPEIEIYNVGGPTEATIWSIYHKYQEEDQKRDRIPQGRGVDNVKYFVMNDDLQLCPCDVQGLMYTEGINVSRGYLKEEEKTKQVFITNPYTGNLMYNTGDFGKYLENGEIDILGRNDDQIKINGKRIELGEIETCCLRVDKVRSAVAVYSEEAGMIALFYAAGEGFDEKALRDELEKQLPEYMLPAVYTRVSEMPVTSNGKIDRKKLASQIDTEALMAEKAVTDRPLNRIESALMEIYRDNLNRSDITVSDNFFRAGGDSLKAIKLLHEITEKVDPNVQLTDIFRFPTVEKLAEHIGEGEEVIVEARHNETSDRMDLSLIQRGMWFQAKAAQMQHSSEIFMLAGSFTIDSGSFDHGRMEAAVNRLISSNPELRTRIFEENYEPYLRYEEPFEYEMQHVKTDAGIDDVRAELEETVRKEAYSFDGFPLFSFRSAETADGKAVVAFGIHHIISDAHSVKLLLDELEGYYMESGSAAGMPGESGVPGEPNSGVAATVADAVSDGPDAAEMSGTDEAVACEGRMLYNDYTVWQEESLAAGSFSEDFEFWSRELDRLTPHRFTEASGEWGDYQGASVDTGIDRNVMQKLERMCAESSSTIYDGIAAAVNVLMKYYFEDRHTAVGLGYAGRNLAAFENTIGCFAVSSMECTHTDSSMKFAELVSQTGQNIKESLAHSSLPFNVYAEKAGKGMDYSLMPYNIMINDISGGNSASADDAENAADSCAAAGSLNAEGGAPADSSADMTGCGCDAGASCNAQAGSVFEDFRYSDAVVPADIMVTLEPGKTISIRYRKNMFEQAEIDVIRSDFRTVIEAAAAEHDITVAELERRLDNM